MFLLLLLLQSRSRHAQDEIARLHIEIGYSFWLYPEWQTRMTVIPVQLYCLFLAAFASMVAPFGGFFASAIKRAYDAKDFDTFIPGHGGLMDRLDCQFIMGLCVRAAPRRTALPPRRATACVLLLLLLLLR